MGQGNDSIIKTFGVSGGSRVARATTASDCCVAEMLERTS